MNKETIKRKFGKFTHWIKGVFDDETLRPSSKRVAGLLIVVVLCIDALVDNINMGETMIYALSSLAFGCLGLTEVSKFFNNKNNNEQTGQTVP
jgi:hypothetical protein